MKQYTVIANWKMKVTDAEAIRLLAELERECASKPRLIEGKTVVICPSFISLKTCASPLKKLGFSLGAQDIYWEEFGACTGETSAPMVAEFARYVLIGHSERRRFRQESDEVIAKKMQLALAHGLVPVCCVGEDQGAYNAGESEQVIERQVRALFSQGEISERQELLIAYEPVWALSSSEHREDASPEYVERMCVFIRQILAQQYNEKKASETKMLYGGNVSRQNVAHYTDQQNVDGVLVGSASLSPEEFVGIIQNIHEV